LKVLLIFFYPSPYGLPLLSGTIRELSAPLPSDLASDICICGELLAGMAN
jgi:hypothetical protein